MAIVTKEVKQDVDLYQHIKNLFETNDFSWLARPWVVTFVKPMPIDTLYRQLTIGDKLEFEYGELENALNRLIADRILGVRIYKVFQADNELPGPTLNTADMWEAALFMIQK